jgi:hypothetical protein
MRWPTTSSALFLMAARRAAVIFGALPRKYDFLSPLFMTSPDDEIIRVELKNSFLAPSDK